MGKFWKFKNEAAESAELFLYGEISDVSWYGDEVTPKQFAEDLASCGDKSLTVHINSPGGDVFAAQAIYNQLKAYKGKVTMMIDGMCASAATVIACAGDTVLMPANTIYMIHNPKSAMMGYFDAAALGKVAERLDMVKQTIVNVYAGRVQGVLSEMQVKEKMDSETWMTAEKAKAYGFVDEVVKKIPIENKWGEGMLIVNSVACQLDRFENINDLRAILPESKGKRSDVFMTLAEKWEAIKMLVTGGERPEEKPTANAVPPVQDNADDVQGVIVKERQRLLALDALKTGDAVIDGIIDAAKTSGATASDVKPYIDAVAAVQPKTPDEEKMLAAVQAILTDSRASNAEAVASRPQAPNAQESDQAIRAASIGEIVSYANKMRGVE